MENICIDKKPLVTVVLMVFNQEKYLNKAFDSILNQTYKNIELIITDNGSNDGSRQILEIISKKYPVKNIILNNKNGNLCDLSNRATKASSGKFITFIAGDDYYHTHFIESNINAFSSLGEEYGVVYSPYFAVEEHTGNISKVKTFHQSGFVFDALVNAQSSTFISAFTPMIKRSVMEEFLYDEDLYCEGECVFIRISSKYKFHYLDSYLYYANKGSSNQGLNYKENTIFHHESNIKLIKRFPEKRILIERSLSKVYFSRAWIALIVMADIEWSKECLKKSIKYCFASILNFKFLILLTLLMLPKSATNFLIKKIRPDNKKFINITYRN